MEKNKGTADGRFGELTLPYVEVNPETKKFKEYPPPLSDQRIGLQFMRY